MNLWLIFLTGLTTGGLSCLAVQGGLLAGVIANQKKQEIDSLTAKTTPTPGQLDWLPVSMFLLAKLISHTILGFLLGALGSVLELSLSARLAFQLFTALFMLATAANLLNLHPAFRFLAFTPPRFIRRFIKDTGKSQTIFAPFLLGLFTVFIPCGVTQAMEVLVISLGDPVQGAATMFAFTLGTMPIFALIGLATSRLTESWHLWFTKFAATVLILMSVYSVNGILQVLDSPLSAQKIISTYQRLQQYETGGSVKSAMIENGVQKMNIEVINNGYSPNYFTVKQGIPVELTVATDGIYSCASAFTFRQYNIVANLKPTDEKTFTFTPDKKGKFTFACSMGMYTGVMEVI